MCELVFSLQELLKILPGFALFPLSFYLAWKTIRHSVSASFTVSHERTIAARISSIYLHNHKDKPVPIYSIHALINKEITFEIDKYDPPLILKPLESLSIKTSEYSELDLSSETYEPEFIGEKIEIYLETIESFILCKKRKNYQLSDFSGVNNLYRKASKHTRRFNGIVYNDNAVYAITYRINSQVKTGIIDKSGFIGREWDYRFNAIPGDSMRSESTVREYLKLAQFDKAVEWFAIDDLRRC